MKTEFSYPTSARASVANRITGVHEEVLAERWKEKVRDGDQGELAMNCKLN